MRCKQHIPGKSIKSVNNIRAGRHQRINSHPLLQLSSLIGNRASAQLLQANQAINKDSRKLFSGQSPCSPTWFGGTEPEVDSNGDFTGKLVVTYNDAALKDPCVRECVEEHEAVHVRDFTPVLKKIHDCDVAAGNDWKKKGECNLMATRELNAARARSECYAYRASFTCLTLKVLDSSNKCSKPPHREEVQKHRGYEACELKNYCKEAGTPELGVPNA